MRKALTLFAVLVVLVATLVAAGYSMAPCMVRNALSERAERIGLTFQTEHVRTDPLRLTVELDEASVRGETTEGAARRVTAKLAWSSLWKGAWVVEHVSFRDVRLHATTKLDPARSGLQSSVVVRQLEVENANIDLPGFKLRDAALSASGLSTQSGDAAPYKLSGRFPTGGTLVSEGVIVSVLPLRAQGEFSYADVPLQSMWRGNKLVDGTASGRGKHTYEGRLVARDASLESTRASYAGIELSRLRLQSPALTIPPREPYEFTGEAAVAAGGSVTASGTIDPPARSADLQVDANSLALASAQRWLPKDAGVRIASGTLTGKGRLQVSRDRGAAYRGGASVSDLRIEEGTSGATLLGWQRAQAAQLLVSPGSVQIAELALEQPEGRLIIDRDGRLNAMTVFRANAGGGKAPLRVAIEQLRITAGTLYFADRSLPSPFETLVRDLSGTISGVHSGGGKPAQVRLAGRVEPSGSARIEGLIDLAAPSAATDVRAAFRNLRLASFNPYVVKFAGYRIESGSVSANLRYRVRESRLEGTNELALEQMQLGEKVQKAGALDLPLELLVALLADDKGRIDLHIPVSGDLRDPKFDFGAIFAQAIGSTVRKVVSAPFRAIGNLLKGDREFGQVAFAPGTAEVSPQARQDLQQVAQALAQRPGLEVSVCGGYDPERDAPALRMLAARREIAERAGTKAPAELDVREMVVAAERLFLERIGSRLELQALRDNEKKNYARALAETLAKLVPVDERATRELARRRAEGIVATLGQFGIDPARMRVVDPERVQAGGSGVPATMKLSARRSKAPAEPAALR